MATVGERLALLERRADENRELIEEVRDILNGGGDVAYPQSVRGRLHKIETTLIGIGARRNYGIGFLKGWERFALVLCGVATAIAAWYHVLLG